jgi:hypothetical protein
MNLNSLRLHVNSTRMPDNHGAFSRTITWWITAASITACQKNYESTDNNDIIVHDSVDMGQDFIGKKYQNQYITYTTWISSLLPAAILETIRQACFLMTFDNFVLVIGRSKEEYTFLLWPEKHCCTGSTSQNKTYQLSTEANIRHISWGAADMQTTTSA